MVDATLSRDGTSVSLPLVDNQSGSPVVGRDIGHPHLNLRSTGFADPRAFDFYNITETYTLTGWLSDESTAYTDAITLADLLKSDGSGPLTLDIPLDRYGDNMSVVPAAGSETAVSLSYEPGDPWVLFDVSLTRVSSYVSNVPDDKITTTPTASGTGPIQLTDGSTTVDLDVDVTIERSVGRPNSTLQRSTGDTFPFYIDKAKSAYDAFEISFDATETANQTVQDLKDLVGQKLGKSSLTLDFNGIFGMGAFSVVPPGARAFRDVVPSGYDSVGFVPTLQLRRVQDTG